MKRSIYYIVIVMMVAGSGCKRVKPQSPSNRPKADSLEMAVTMFNLRMAEESDLLCTQYVSNCGQSYVLSDDGYWYRIEHPSQSPESETIKEGDLVELYYCTYTLDGQLIEDVQQQITVGKRETFFALDLILPQLSESDHVQLVCPYYTSYGIEASEKAGAYTNCIIHVNEIHVIEHKKQ